MLKTLDRVADLYEQAQNKLLLSKDFCGPLQSLKMCETGNNF